jgi:hypothetical protein
VQGAERLAGLSIRRDWAETCEGGVLHGTLAELSLDQRRQLGDEWAKIGLMEHASIAAFARFSLQLLSLGAPVALVEACNQAMVDETLHARLAFGLASQFSGSAIGPGKLNVDHALDADDFESIVMNTVLEGCIGETVAAIEARELLARAQDPSIRQVLSQIAHDEQRHADLAWQVVRWALSERPEMAVRVELLVQREAQQAAARTRGEPEASWMGEFGILSGAERAELKASVLTEVVRPCVKALAAQSCATSPIRELVLS